jgi:hypothetical protein
LTVKFEPLGIKDDAMLTIRKSTHEIAVSAGDAEVVLSNMSEFSLDALPALFHNALDFIVRGLTHERSSKLEYDNL